MSYKGSMDTMSKQTMINYMSQLADSTYSKLRELTRHRQNMTLMIEWMEKTIRENVLRIRELVDMIKSQDSSSHQTTTYEPAKQATVEPLVHDDSSTCISTKSKAFSYRQEQSVDDSQD